MLSNLKSVEENREYLKSIIGVVNRRNEIDWRNSIGKEIKYEYNWGSEYSKGTLKIIKYEDRRIYFEGYEKGIHTGDLTKCKLSGVLNIIWNKAPWMIDLGVSEEDAKKYTIGSDKKIEVKCPDCGRIKKATPKMIHLKHSIGCSCGDGISYPEKLMESVLIQTCIKYERQYKIDESKNKMYDFYLTDYNIIIETHGGQHYEEGGGFPGKSLKEEQENDKFKKELALSNGISRYIIIDCRKSELEYIKNNILNSELNELFDFSKVDWVKCGEYASSNLVKEVCNYYNKHPEFFTSDLAKEFGVCKVTIANYLKIGTQLGWCKYDSREEARRRSRRSGKLIGERLSKPIAQFTLDGELIKTYPSAHEAERQTGIRQCNISECCRGKRKTANGYMWKFV